jgi:hypothetical protein
MLQVLLSEYFKSKSGVTTSVLYVCFRCFIHLPLDVCWKCCIWMFQK